MPRACVTSRLCMCVAGARDTWQGTHSLPGDVRRQAAHLLGREGGLGWGEGRLGRFVLCGGLNGRDDLGDNWLWVGHKSLVDVHLFRYGLVDVELRSVSVGVVMTRPPTPKHLQVLLIFQSLPYAHCTRLEGQSIPGRRLIHPILVILRLRIRHLQRPHRRVLRHTTRTIVAFFGEVEMNSSVLLGWGLGFVLFVEEGTVEVWTG